MADSGISDPVSMAWSRPPTRVPGRGASIAIAAEQVWISEAQAGLSSFVNSTNQRR